MTESRIQKPLRIAYSGIEGSFAHIATTRIFKDDEAVSYIGFASAYKAVVDKKADAVVLPIENSFAGEVGAVTDLIHSGNLIVEEVYELKVNQCLLGTPDSREEDIKKVISHPQAIEQCASYIAEHKLDVITCVNTAVAAKTVSDTKDSTYAAIASKETAPLYGLKILHADINDSDTNVTRFAVLKREEDVDKTKDYGAFVLMFTLKNEAGTLSRAISVIADYGYNMRVIKSRPLHDGNWTYYFYTEVEGKYDSKEGQEMLARLNNECTVLKIAGTYNPDILI